MANNVAPTRRSPRSIERFCNGVIHPGLTAQQSAILLALAHCSGWSADHIARRVQLVTGVSLSAEQVFNCHWSWINGRRQYFSVGCFEIAQTVLSGIGLNLLTCGRPLSQTKYPRTINFADCWTLSSVNSPLFPGYTKEARDCNKAFIAGLGLTAFSKLTPIERALTGEFGGTIIDIIENALKRWTRDVRVEFRDSPGPRPIRQKWHVNLIMNYLHMFQDEYEWNFGWTGDKGTAPLGEIKNNTVYIQGHGDGMKIFLGLLMADRLQVVDESRRKQRVQVGFEELIPEDLAEDSKNCNICGDEFGVQNQEGRQETPIKLTICCGQVFGNKCLRQWVSELAGGASFQNSCPGCRFKFPASFIEKLLTPEEYQQRINHVFHPRHEAIILSATPSPTLPEATENDSQAPMDFEVFEEDVRHQEELRIQQVTADEDMVIETSPMLPEMMENGRRGISIDLGVFEEDARPQLAMR